MLSSVGLLGTDLWRTVWEVLAGAWTPAAFPLLSWAESWDQLLVGGQGPRPAPPLVAVVGARVDDAACTVGPGVVPGAPVDLPFRCRPQPCSPSPASPVAGTWGPGSGPCLLARPGHVADAEASHLGA